MKLTIELNLNTSAEQGRALSRTMEVFNAAANEAARVGFDSKSFNQVGLHHKVYRSLRDQFKIPAQMAVRAIGKAVAVFARDRRKCPVFRPLGAVSCDARMVTHRPAKSAISLLTLDGRVEIPYSTAERNRTSLVGKWGEIKLVLRGTTYYLQVAVERPEEPRFEPVSKVGVDLGITNIATLSTGETFTGKRLQLARTRYAKQRSGLQSKGTRSARRKLRKLSGREKRFAKEVNHVISRRVVDKAKALQAGLVIEDLSGIRSKRSGKVVRTLLNSWSFFQLRTFLTYKATLAGVPLEVVSPRYTSQTCSACGHCEKANRRGKKFSCRACGHKSDADLNASINIARRGEPEMLAEASGAEVNRPTVATA